MKNKVLFFIIGVLVIAIIAIGVLMLTNKNNPKSKSNSNGGNGDTMYQGTGEPPTQAEIDAAEKTIQEDGSIRYDLPGGGTLVEKQGGTDSDRTFNNNWSIRKG